MDFRFSVSSVDLTEKDKSVNEANLTLVTCRVVDTYNSCVKRACNVNGNVQYIVCCFSNHTHQ